MITSKLAVQGMTCGNCASRVTKALEQVEGVSEAVVSLQNASAVVQHEHSLMPEVLKAAVQSKGFKATLLD
ncbi:MAG: heavy metal-associated domain-containing protein [Sumerlaeia bacterium]